MPSILATGEAAWQVPRTWKRRMTDG
jgi:hypothetical protein